MSEYLPTYKKPLPSTKEPVISEEFWEEAKDKFEKKEYKESIIAVINYLNRDILKKVNRKKDIKFTQMHGSVEVNIEITDTAFKIYVPFLKIDEKTNKIALLRRVAEINFSYFDLTSIELNGDILELNYESPLELCKPIKIHNLIKDICFLSDEYDDDFIKKYGAKFIKEPKVKKLTKNEEEIAYYEIRRILKEYKSYAIDFKEKQKDAYRWDMAVITLLKISNMPYVNGHLKYEIIEAIRTLYNGDLDFDYRIQKGQEKIEELYGMSQEEITANLYHAELFTSMLFISSPDIIKDRLENNIETLQKYEKDENKFAISYYLQTIFLKLIYNYNLSKEYKQEIENTLVKISGLKAKEASPKLIRLFNKLYNKEVKKVNLKYYISKAWDYTVIFAYTVFFLFILSAIVAGIYEGVTK